MHVLRRAWKRLCFLGFEGEAFRSSSVMAHGHGYSRKLIYMYIKWVYHCIRFSKDNQVLSEYVCVLCATVADVMVRYCSVIDSRVVMCINNHLNAMLSRVTLTAFSLPRTSPNPAV